jgi:rhodanese-related sulfurtransferase
MFNFKDLSDKAEDFKAQNYLLTADKFFEKRRTTKQIYVFDLRSSQDFEESHLPGAHNLPFEQFEDSIYQMPFSADIMLTEATGKRHYPQQRFFLITDSKHFISLIHMTL